MQLKFLKAKLHMAAITCNVPHYHGSLTLDPELMDAVGLHPYEAILVSNVANGQRAETYVLPGVPGQRQVELNGAMARLGLPGDRIIIMSYAMLEPEEIASHRPVVAILDQSNEIIQQITHMIEEPSEPDNTYHAATIGERVTEFP